jgi:hypothetical protein
VTVFFADERISDLSLRLSKIVRSTSIVVENEQIADRRNSPLKSIADTTKTPGVFPGNQRRSNVIGNGKGLDYPPRAAPVAILIGNPYLARSADRLGARRMGDGK